MMPKCAGISSMPRPWLTRKTVSRLTFAFAVNAYPDVSAAQATKSRPAKSGFL
jgi:hypothetical protein